jgi:subtilase family serine protease
MPAVDAVGALAPGGVAAPTPAPTERTCAAPAAPHRMSCMSVRRIDSTSRTGNVADADPGGFTPADLRDAYDLPAANSTATIAIIDAYDDPRAESDLGVYRQRFGLPACTTANGCFKKVNQTGGTRLPRTNAGWALEISLDIQWAHAIAPGAHILLVEANSNSFANLLAAEDYAKTHAQYVSNSWGASEFLLSAATLRKVFLMLSVRSASGQASGAW